MRSKLKSKRFVWLLALATLCSSAQAMELEADIKYPVGMGATSAGYTSTVGFGAAIYFEPLLDPAIFNSISVGYQSYKIRADGSSALRFIPVLFNLQAHGKIFSDFDSTFGVGAGFAGAFVSITGVQTMMNNWSAYFVMQIKPGFEWRVSEGVGVVGHVPVTMFISRAFMSSMDFDLGVKFKI